MIQHTEISTTLMLQRKTMTTIYCIGRNYKAHAEELGNKVPTSPLVYLVSETSIRGFQQSPIAFKNETFHYEGEIVLKIAKDHELNEKSTPQSIESLALGIDLTRRGEQIQLKSEGYPWTTSKSFLGSTILSDFTNISNFTDLKNIEYEFYLNDELKQKANTSDMIFDIQYLCDYINTFSPLKKGDLILTGTPQGVGEIRRGDHFKMRFTQQGIEAKGIL